MLRKLIALAVPLLLLPIWLDDSCTCTAIALRSAAGLPDLKRLQHTRQIPLSDDTPVVTSFDYEFGYDGIQATQRQASRRQQQRRQQFKSNPRTTTTSTTERPLVRYWNSFVRSVRLPMSNLSLRNLTNPLAHLFNDGSADIVETPPSPLDEYETGGSDPPSPSYSSNRKQPKRKRKHGDKQSRQTYYPQYENVAAVDGGDDFFNSPNYDNAAPLYYYLQQQPYGGLPKLRNGQPTFFYDAPSGNYYGVQRLSAQDYYAQANLYNYYYPTDQLTPTDANDESDDDAADSNDVEDDLEAERDSPTLPTEFKTDTDGDVDDNADDDVDDNADGDVDDKADGDVVGDVDGNADGDVDDNTDVDTVPIEGVLRSASELQSSEQLGMYMRDDGFSRKRQRASARDNPKQLAMAKQEPRHQFSYYVLSPL